MSDELIFDFGVDFKESTQRAAGEASERHALKGKLLTFGHSYLDDALVGILPKDLVLVGAETGAGKTQFVTSIALANVREGKRVHYVALEAEDKEIERRIIHSIVSRMCGTSSVRAPSFAEWMTGGFVSHKIDQDAAREFDKQCSGLKTYYRGSKFSAFEIRKLFLSVQNDTDLLILDHLHYVDIEDTNENRGLKDLIKTLRDIALGMGKPVILVAHLRKRDLKAKGIAPAIDDFHGSSDVGKIATRAIILSPARCMRSDVPGQANTFLQIVKDRFDGAKPYYALSAFDMRTKQYAQAYSLGYETSDGGWQCVREHVPSWAKRHSEYNHGQAMGAA